MMPRRHKKASLRSERSNKFPTASIQVVLLTLLGVAFLIHGVAMRWLTRNAPPPYSHKEQSNSHSLSGENTAVGKNSNNDHLYLEQLPKWIQRYVLWHGEMRAKFPGASIFTDPTAPPLLIRTCLGLCGGLHDRIGQLPWDLYLANQTGRVLFLSWHRPVPLENFLLPNTLNWSVPVDVKGFFPTTTTAQRQRGHAATDVRVSREGMKVVRAYQELFAGMGDETQPDTEFFAKHVDAAIARAVSGPFKDVKVLRHRILGHLDEDALERRLAESGETDMLHRTPSFGNIFRIFFRPASGVQAILDSVYKDLHLKPGSYSGVHCRVRHPKAAPRGIEMLGKNEGYTADRAGLPWVGETRKYAVQVATRALLCAKAYFIRSNDANEPIYFFSDSNDLVRFMAMELTSDAFVKGNEALFSSSPVDAAALEAVKEASIVARDMTMENTHIDKQKGRDPPAYYMTFVDLLLAVNARCLAYGVGYYAVFAAKISGTPCKLLYQEERWGGLESKKDKAQQCVLPSDKN